MSHDRGCFCGRERYEYEDCPKADCRKKNKEAIVKKAKPMPKRTKSYVVTRQTATPIYHTKDQAIIVAKAMAETYPDTPIHVSEVKENYTFEQPQKKGKIIRRYFKPEEPKDV